jgi:phosphatidylinositol-3-phosphatase
MIPFIWSRTRMQAVGWSLLPLLVLALMAAGCGSQASTSIPSIAKRNSPCGRIHAGSASYSHVIWLWMENQSYNAVTDSRSAPFLVSLERQCGLATSYSSITHPSLPNYIAATSGVSRDALARFTTDCSPSASCSTSARSIFTQASSWRTYEESMPRPCDRRDAGLYAVRHNPPAYYRPLAEECVRKDLPIDRFHAALARDSLPAFSFITPNLCHDNHDCTVSTADGWLAREVEMIVQSSTYQAGHTVVFISYDEGPGDTPADCTAHPHASSCHVATVVVSPSTPPRTRSAERFNHYSLLRTTEDLLGLAHLGMAARAPSMSPAFGL